MSEYASNGNANRRSVLHAVGSLLAGAAVPARAGPAISEITGPRHALKTADPVASRPLFQAPFNKRSIWNVPINKGAIYQTAAPGNETSSFRNIVPRENGGNPWIGQNAIALWNPNAGDPLVPVVYEKRPEFLPWPFDTTSTYYKGGTVMMRIPENICLPAYDGWTIVFDPDGRHFFEMWAPHGQYGPSRDINGKLVGFKAAFLAYNDARGTGIPGDPATPQRHDGVRAPGWSLLGGLVRNWEIAEGKIEHAIAFTLSQGQLKAADNPADRCVWPAYHPDSGQTYRGAFPMGGMVAIPKAVDLSAQGLTAAGLTIARAYQDYGGYCCDCSTDTNNIAIFEYGAPQSFFDQLFLNSYTKNWDLRKIIALCCFVPNNSSTAIAAGVAAGLPYPIPVGGGL